MILGIGSCVGALFLKEILMFKKVLLILAMALMMPIFIHADDDDDEDVYITFDSVEDSDGPAYTPWEDDPCNRPRYRPWDY